MLEQSSQLPLTVLSLGAGVQSTTLLLMSCKGILPKLDAAVFADTQWEPPTVYAHLGRLTKYAAKHRIPVHRTTAGNLREHVLEGYVRGSVGKKQPYATMPLHTIQATGSKGMLKRQCSKEYKLAPIAKCVRRELLGLKPGERAPANAVRQWIGITSDEMRRARQSGEHWRTNVFPFLNLPERHLPRTMTRRACLQWLAEHFPDWDVPRSSCIGCPYHSNAEWRNIQADPETWVDAVEVDRAIRQAAGMRGETYLHRSCVPLEDVDLRTDVEKGQSLLWQEECLGMCGV